MSEDIGSTSPAAGRELAPRTPPRAATGRGGARLAWLVAFAALVVALVALWRVYALEHGRAAAQAGAIDDLGARLDALSRTVDQRKRDIDGLRARLTDADDVNKSVREELLALGERSRHLEDAVANLSEQRLSGRDALALNEAEFLLQQAQERLALFQDAAAAISAYRLADSALAAAEDPVFASVRQTIGAERQALEASRPAETHAALAALARLREAAAALPARQAAAQAGPATTSRWSGFIEQFVKISHDDADPLAARDPGLARSLVVLDLRDAEAALLARDGDGYKAALGRARTGITATFDEAAPPTRASLAEIDRLAAEPLAPALPELGSALKELRNLRATRALAHPPVPAARVAAPDGAGT
ncbi:uroporphyrinogen-III C-methyltransferase [Dokdonella fugitiva]|uniref:uroporphyrinogen-III C-methyltransferase n=1 Tax=Dokdonella fugitiva TaxID=328517 RepID=UPI0015FC2D62|nr:uroporphyrinogen-III C-methyltransferase [Dokdonella fugitiva]MBA8882918.1 uroporphyrin-3 C-methyltransferase [Dokdonella fugitiva]